MWSNWVRDGISRGCSRKQLYDVMMGHGVSSKEAMGLLGWRPNPGRAIVRSGPVSVVDDVLSDMECDVLIGLAFYKGVKRNKVVNHQGGEREDEGRTSDGVGFRKYENGFLKSIEERLAKLTDWPVEYGEGLQILRYQQGCEYRPHVDWFDDSAGGKEQLKRGGQRYGTVVVYLKCADEGGGTSFPNLGMTVTPKRGSAVCFMNVDEQGNPMELVRHSGDPVVKGEKIVMTLWQREGRFE